MTQSKSSTKRSSELSRVVKEKITGGNAELTTFTFQRGANVYAFSYEVQGQRKHTLIDAGDPRHQEHIESILIDNGILPASIERIIITHRHLDHAGLARTISRESKAKILVHAGFRSFVEGPISETDRVWWHGFDISEFRRCDIEYLTPSNDSGATNIGGMDFAKLSEPIVIGDAGSLSILACPEDFPTHTPDQLIIVYSPEVKQRMPADTRNGLRPTDCVLFSGDLWLMTGPVTNWRMRDFPMHIRRKFYQMKRLVTGKGRFRLDPTEQDAKAKEALKRGFSLVRVKPGHGDEFLGSRIIPNGLLADRDLLVKLGFPIDADQSVLKSKVLVHRIKGVLEAAYASFVQELLHWMELGYSISEISELLTRIYNEQTGGSRLTAIDRRQRRARIRQALARLKHDATVSDELRQLAEMLSVLK